MKKMDIYEESNSYNDLYIKQKISQNYLTIPILIKFKKPDKKVNTAIGLYYAYMISTIRKSDGNYTDSDGEKTIIDEKNNETKVIQNLGRNDLGIIFQFGYDYEINENLGWFILLQPKIGLIPTIKPKLGENFSLSIGTGVKLNK